MLEIKPEFPYRPLLEELTVAVVNNGLDPYEAYGWLYKRQNLQALSPQTYCSTSITSGGHARDNSIGMKEVIQRNTASAMLLAEQLMADKQIAPEATIEPVSLGKTNWNQAQYMEFWLSVIGGYELTTGFISRDVDMLRNKAQGAFVKTELDLDLMTGDAPAADRAIEYFKMSHAFKEIITDGLPVRPIGTIVRMIDTELSLGAQTERAFARQIGSKVMNISVVKPASPDEIQAVNHVLSEDVARLISFGATIFDTAHNRVRLLLEHDAA